MVTIQHDINKVVRSYQKHLYKLSEGTSIFKPLRNWDHMLTVKIDTKIYLCDTVGPKMQNTLYGSLTTFYACLPIYLYTRWHVIWQEV